MARTTFQGSIRAMNGVYNFGGGSVVNIPDATNTLTLTPALHAGRILRTNDATLVLTLPPIIATTAPTSGGPGITPATNNNVGMSFTIFIETAVTAFKLSTDGTDKYVGSILLVDTDTAGATTGYAPGATNDVINFNGSTLGGIAGSWVKVTALASAKWLVQGVGLASGAPATPFADS